MEVWHSQLAAKLHDELRDVGAKQESARSEPTLKEVVLQVADVCNLKCSYCYADGGDYGVSPLTFMEPETAASRVRELMLDNPDARSIKFFGGEPSLNQRAIDAVVDQLRAMVDDGSIDEMPRLGMVTNLARVKPAFAGLLTDGTLEATVSIDGPAEIHDAYRPPRSGRGSYDRTAENFRRLTRQGAQLGVTALFTPTHVEAGLDAGGLYDYLWDSFRPTTILISPLGRADCALAEEEWLEFELALRHQGFALGQRWVSTLDRPPSQRRVRQEIETCMHGSADDSFCGAGKTTTTVDSDGSDLACYFFKDGSLASFADSKSEIPHCQGCDFIRTCHQCPGLLNRTSGSPRTPVQADCSFWSGVTEGCLHQLAEEYTAGGERWQRVANLIQGSAVSADAQVDCAYD